MDSLGDGDELAFDDEPPARPVPFLTPEARAFIGAGLVLASLMGASLFQVFAFAVLNDNDPNADPWRQYLNYAGMSGVLAAAGAVMGWPVRRAPTSASVRGLAAAAVVVGTVIALGVIAGLVAIAMRDPQGNSTF
jgi:pheromone shutdown protein TraB